MLSMLFSCYTFMKTKLYCVIHLRKALFVAQFHIRLQSLRMLSFVVFSVTFMRPKKRTGDIYLIRKKNIFSHLIITSKK